MPRSVLTEQSGQSDLVHGATLSIDSTVEGDFEIAYARSQ
jgi:hypothetical protein